MAAIYGGIPCVDPATFRRECLAAGLPLDPWWGRANGFDLNPIGKEPGKGWVLLTRSDLDSLDLTTDHTLTFSGETAATAVSLASITFLSAQCCSPGAEADPAAVYLCTLTDPRYFLGKTPVNTAYNVVSADGTGYLTQTKNGGSAWTWQQVVQDLATALGIGTQTLPFTPDGTPENLSYWGGDAWESLHDVLARLACGLRYNPTAGTFSVVRLGLADSTASAALATLDATPGRRTWDAYPEDPVRAWRPEKVRVQFLRRPAPIDGTSPYYTVDVTLAATAGVKAGTYVTLDDDAAALAATGTPSNSAALATRAAERAADWLRKRGGYERPVLKVYRDFLPGVVRDVPGATVGQVRLDDRGGAMSTMVAAKPDGLLEAWKPFSLLPPWTAVPGPLTTKGDLWGFSTTNARVPVGTNTHVLTADSGEALGVKWAAVGGSGLVDGDYGDITVSGSATVWTIDADAVTYAKMQNVSAASRLLGRGSASGSGDVEEIAVSGALKFSGTTLTTDFDPATNPTYYSTFVTNIAAGGSYGLTYTTVLGINYLTVNTGCGLELAAGAVRVKKADIAGTASATGLVVGANCSVGVDLTPDSTATENVDTVTGFGMVAGNLRLAYTRKEFTNVFNAAGLLIDRFETDSDAVTRDVDPCLFDLCCADDLGVVAGSPTPSSGTTATEFDFTCTASGGGGGYTYLWTFADGDPATSTSEDPVDVQFTSPGTKAWSVVVTDACGRTANDSGTVDVNGFCDLYITEVDSVAHTFDVRTGPLSWEETGGGYTLETNSGGTAWLLTEVGGGPRTWSYGTWDGTGTVTFAADGAYDDISVACYS